MNTKVELPIIASLSIIPAGFIEQAIIISQKTGDEGNKKYSPIGKVKYALPTLAAFGIEAKITGTDEETGIPVYEQEAHNWLIAAVDAKLTGMIRNRVDNTTGRLKPGATIPASLAEITAEGGNSGAALKVIAEAKRDFAAWIATLGKSQAAQSLLTSLFASRQAVTLQDAVNRGKFAAYLGDFAAQLSEEKLQAYQRYLDGLAEATETEHTATDF